MTPCLIPRAALSLIPRAARRGFDSARNAGFDSPAQRGIANLIPQRETWALTPLLQRGLMLTQVKLFLLLRTHWPLESSGFVLARAVRVFLLFTSRPAPCSRILFDVGLSLLSCLFDSLLVGLLSGVAGSAPLIHVCALGAFDIDRRDSPVAVPCAGWAPLAAVPS